MCANMIMKKVLNPIFFLFIFSSCFQAASNNRLGNSNDNVKLDPNCPPGQVSCLTGGGGNGIGGSNEETIAKVEIRHLIEPKIDENGDGGDYKRKLTIPKNYNGDLYIAGINISTLSANNITVRFKFGVDASPITIPATVSTAPGLTPQTNVEVLVLDMRSQPFKDIQLLYELYDYNSYDFAGTGSDPGALQEPVGFNRDDKLFCRGLKLQDDNTFSGNVTAGCLNGTDTCKYAFAKVVDKGLIEIGAEEFPIVPDERNIQRTPAGYNSEDNSTKLARCLPDNPDLTGGSYNFDLTNVFPALETFLTIDSTLYFYRGPYRPINSADWEINGNAIVGQFGLFKKVPDIVTVNGQVDTNEIQYGQQSLLFPLYTKFDLPKDTQFMGSSTPDALKTLSVMTSNDESTFMDGCNARASTVDDITGEHIGSCNVTATIEILSTDDDGVVTIIDVTDEVKLQIVKPVELDTNGDNVLLSSFQSCSSSSQCGADSCCINKRCWSKAIVSQCVEDLPSFGNQETGETCNSDYECSSLCCNKIDGRCAPHDTIAETPSFCSKPAGQACVAKEFCQKHPVRVCAIVLTGTDTFGNQTCNLRCITTEVFGECVADDGRGVGICKPPCQSPDPVFNPSDPNRCDGVTQTFQDLVNEANNPNRECN